MENAFIIYLAAHPAHGTYVGMTRSGLSNRKSAHFSAARRGSNLLFHKALREHPSGWTWQVLHVTMDEDEAIRLEVMEIAARPSLLNVHTGGKNWKYRPGVTNPRKGRPGKKASAEWVQWVTEFHQTRPRKRKYDREAMRRMHADGCTQMAIAAALGCDQALVSRVVRKIYRQ